MATSRSPSSTARSRVRHLGRGLRKVAWIIVLGFVALLVLYGASLARYAHTATAYAAHAGCACHYIQGRPLGDCRRDFEGRMALVTLGDDPEARRVTARFALMAPTRATFVEGAGCQLEPWVRQ